MDFARTFCLLVALAGSSSGAQAQAPQLKLVPDSRAQALYSFAPVVKRVSPAVVNVYGTARVERPRGSDAQEEFFRRFFGEGGPGLPQERARRSLGSGVIVDASGLVITNHHVIEGMTEVKVTLSDRREFDAKIVLRDPRTDLAALQLVGNGPFPVMSLGDSDALEVGDLVLAVGNPFGVGQTVTSGIVSALARTQIGVSDYQFFIQTDAAINPGNSGGALVDMNGALVGINSAIYSRSGGNIGIGFAIPATMVKVVVASAKMGGSSVRRPYLGATLQTITAEIAESLGLPRPVGVLVARVADKTPAAEAGLLRGDLIITIDGQDIDNVEAFGFRFGTKPIGGTTKLGVLRGGKPTILTMKLVGAPETRPRDERKIGGRNPFTGATVMAMSPAVAEDLSIDTGEEGVVVAGIDGSTIASQFFEKGDIILGINNQKVETPRELERVAAQPQGGQWRITLKRKGKVINTVIGG